MVTTKAPSLEQSDGARDSIARLSQVSVCAYDESRVPTAAGVAARGVGIVASAFFGGIPFVVVSTLSGVTSVVGTQRIGVQADGRRLIVRGAALVGGDYALAILVRLSDCCARRAPQSPDAHRALPCLARPSPGCTRACGQRCTFRGPTRARGHGGRAYCTRHDDGNPRRGEIRGPAGCRDGRCGAEWRAADGCAPVTSRQRDLRGMCRELVLSGVRT